MTDVNSDTSGTWTFFFEYLHTVVFANIPFVIPAVFVHCFAGIPVASGTGRDSSGTRCSRAAFVKVSFLVSCLVQSESTTDDALVTTNNGLV